ncbi:hypothetical protein BDP55DRAFT_155806 [Colletotrichum godetiae]|uniref:Uncharacterized protein n=1 Tax=Colletotrichum godetiae TaxID=1209918 RepID=A0AAJ0AKE2_9PEZI|nr:uncharacterized protein BDP55DRAFT_155806 [Colletotrichum godetiae]KAK1675492.1 hypothetical protein BDP55DRAFT_155806 [Colletotrichum godetiae]
MCMGDLGMMGNAHVTGILSSQNSPENQAGVPGTDQPDLTHRIVDAKKERRTLALRKFSVPPGAGRTLKTSKNHTVAPASCGGSILGQHPGTPDCDPATYSRGGSRPSAWIPCCPRPAPSAQRESGATLARTRISDHHRPVSFSPTIGLHHARPPAIRSLSSSRRMMTQGERGFKRDIQENHSRFEHYQIDKTTITSV